MSGCNPITYHNVTERVFSCLKELAKKHGIPVPPGTSGHISKYGVEADYVWDGTSNLTVTVTDKPFIFSCGSVAGKITDLIHQCGGS